MKYNEKETILVDNALPQSKTKPFSKIVISLVNGNLVFENPRSNKGQASQLHII